MPTITIDVSTATLTDLCAAVGAIKNAGSGGTPVTPAEVKAYFIDQFKSTVRAYKVEQARKQISVAEPDIT